MNSEPSFFIQSVGHSIMDPIHGIMMFNEQERDLIKCIIDHPCFQRLRHIKQLGMADYVFPGATHTRFSHSLGVAYLSSRIFKRIMTDKTEESFSKYQDSLLACLIHDIGHGPFSHAFEKFLRNQSGESVDHEQWTPLFINRLKEEVPQIACDWSRVGQFIDGSAEESIFSSIVSSQLDADRLDYLLRDSHFCGVKYGEYDLDWILRCLAVVEIDGRPRLAIDKKGSNSVEQFLIARRQMTHNIYYHAKVRAVESLLEALLVEVAALDHAAIRDVAPPQLASFLLHAKSFREGCSELGSFMSSAFPHYRKLTDSHVWVMLDALSDASKNSSAKEIALRITQRRLPSARYIKKEDFQISDEFVRGIRETHHIAHWQLRIIDAPFKTLKTATKPIYIRQGNRYAPYGEHSFLRALADRDDGLKILIVDPDINQKIQKKIREFLHEKHILNVDDWKKAS